MTNNQLDSIPKCRVQEAAQSLSKLHGYLLGCKGQNGSKGDDGEEVDNENGGRVPSVVSGDDAHGHHDEEEIDIVWIVAQEVNTQNSSRRPAHDPFPLRRRMGGRGSDRVGTHC